MCCLPLGIWLQPYTEDCTSVGNCKIQAQLKFSLFLSYTRSISFPPFLCTRTPIFWPGAMLQHVGLSNSQFLSYLCPKTVLTTTEEQRSEEQTKNKSLMEKIWECTFMKTEAIHLRIIFSTAFLHVLNHFFSPHSSDYFLLMLLPTLQISVRFTLISPHLLWSQTNLIPFSLTLSCKQ